MATAPNDDWPWWRKMCAHWGMTWHDQTKIRHPTLLPITTRCPRWCRVSLPPSSTTLLPSVVLGTGCIPDTQEYQRGTRWRSSRYTHRPRWGRRDYYEDISIRPHIYQCNWWERNHKWKSTFLIPSFLVTKGCTGCLYFIITLTYIIRCNSRLMSSYYSTDVYYVRH